MNDIKIRFHGGLEELINKEKNIKISLALDATFEKIYEEIDLDKNAARILVENGKLIEDYSRTISKNAKIDLYPIFGGG